MIAVTSSSESGWFLSICTRTASVCLSFISMRSQYQKRTQHGRNAAVYFFPMTTEGIRQHREAIAEIPKSEQLRALHDFIHAYPLQSIDVSTHVPALQSASYVAEYALADPDTTDKETYLVRTVEGHIVELLAHCAVDRIGLSNDTLEIDGRVTSPFYIRSHSDFEESIKTTDISDGFVKDGGVRIQIERTDDNLRIATTFTNEHWLENSNDVQPHHRRHDDYLALLEQGVPQTGDEADFFRELLVARETLEAMVGLYNRARVDTTRIANASRSVRDLVAKLGLTQDVSIRDVKHTMKSAGIPNHEFDGSLHQIGHFRRISDKDSIDELLLFLQEKIAADDSQKWRWHRTIDTFANTYLGMNTHAVKDYIRLESYGHGGETIPIDGEVNLVVDSGHIEIWLGSGETWSGSHSIGDRDADDYEPDTPGGSSYTSFIDPDNSLWQDEQVALQIKRDIESTFAGLEVVVTYNLSGSFHEAFQTHDIRIDAKEAQRIGSTLGMEWDETLAKIREISRDIVRKAKQTKE